MRTTSRSVLLRWTRGFRTVTKSSQWPATASFCVGRRSNTWTKATRTWSIENDHGCQHALSVNQHRGLATQSARPSVTSEVKAHGPGNHIATIVVSNPSKLNIVNSAILDELVARCQELSQDHSLRAVVLTGGDTASGKAPSFIGGADITEMHSLRSPDEARAFITRIHLACKALRDIPVPVIARINGFALGAGLEIMAACDLRIATEASVVGMPEVKIGIPSVVEAALLPGLIGMGRTRRLLYLAENIKAREAERWGLVEKVVKDEMELEQSVDDWVARIAEMGPKAIRDQKRLMQTWENVSTDDGIMAGVDAFADAFEDGGIEPHEMMSKFVNRKRT